MGRIPSGLQTSVRWPFVLSFGKKRPGRNAAWCREAAKEKGPASREYPWTRVDIAITTERAGVKGWIAFASEVRATAQGSTEEEAKANLSALLQWYPELLKSHGQSPR